MKKEMDKYRARCERLEREKDELSNKKTRVSGSGSESMRLQQRIRELEATNEDLIDDKRSAELRASELERDLESRPSTAQTHKVSNFILKISIFFLHFLKIIFFIFLNQFFFHLINFLFFQVNYILFH